MPLKLIDPEDPRFKGRSWLEIEEHLDALEREDLAELGIELPPGAAKRHMLSNEYEDAGLIPEKVVSMPWEEPVSWGDFVPKCTSKNWTHKDLKFEEGNGIVYLTLNAAERNNSLNDEVEAAFKDACYELQGRKDIRIVVLKAEGRMFCAGGDPKGFQDAAAMSDADNRKGAVEFAKFLYQFQTLPQFTICCAQGSAMGGGVGFVSICDMVIAVQSAFFVLSEVKLGVIPATISPYVVAKLGASNSNRYFCTAENISAMKAKEMGLVQEVVDKPEDFQGWIKTIAEKLTQCAPEAVHSSKKLVMNVANQPMSETLLAYTGSELARVRKTAEAADGMKAIQERRKPYWAENDIKPK
eukprot:gnl/MRDRNA2_/MRDRNA2_112412_c0_seq1.p1 gnl/MRDRNA2_/MRDRNA2_112412_c0~~gnl/MRDRNA2_/MRDRNA2_112412_c0_seq1.p1  ORF type:complete len:355 (-),score=90.54 gnl/MRDRNA2_/MRDRNA2_112412_c0_seq1:68-1132(-)